MMRTQTSMREWFGRSTIVVGLGLSMTSVMAQADKDAGLSWPPTADALEACIVAEKKDMETGAACIGRHARWCLRIAQREPIVNVEKCYMPELTAWANLEKRYFIERPGGTRGRQIAEVQRAWVVYRDLKCGYIDVHHGGGSAGYWQRVICLMEETARRAIDLHAFKTTR